MRSNLLRMFSALTLAAMLPLALNAHSRDTPERQFTVTVDTSAAGIAIPQDFLGLSFETADTLPKIDGTYPYFRASNHDLVNLFQTLGIKSLRIGGNTSDRPGVPVPDTHDIDHLFAFAKAADAKVIYTLRLRDSSPEKDAPLAKYLEEHYARDISCLVVGNEPDVYEKQYPHYRDDLHQYLAAILAPGIAPNAKICGPSTTPGHPDWSNNFVADFGPTGHILWITQHSYPGGNSKKVTDPAAQRERILSPEFAEHYQKLADSFVPAVEAAHMQYRIEETNSFYNGGAKDVSNTFASSLWALKYLYWWAAHRSQGVNFHTGDFVAAGPVQTICWYGIFHTLPGGGYEIRPIAYAMKAFDLTGHGTLIPVSGLPASTRVNAYAVVDHNSHALYLTLINSGHERATHAESTEEIRPRGIHAAVRSRWKPRRHHRRYARRLGDQRQRSMERPLVAATTRSWPPARDAPARNCSAVETPTFQMRPTMTRSLRATALVLASLFTAAALHAQAPASPADTQANLEWSQRVVDSTLARYPDPAKFGSWGYQRGLYLFGQYLVYRRTHDPRYLKYIEDWVDTHIDAQGHPDHKINSLDSIMAANLLVVLYQETHEQRYKLGADYFRSRFDDYPRTTDGGFWHATVPSRQWQLWLDGTYMAEQFLLRYGQAFHDSDYTNQEVVRQLLVYHKHLKSPSGLLYHAYDESGKSKWGEPGTHHSHYFWCRAIGWYGMTLVDTLDVLPKDQPGRAQLIHILRSLVEALARTQDPKTGLWYQIVDKPNLPGNWTETSSSSMFTYIVDVAVKRGYVPKKYHAVAEKGYRGVLSRLSLGPDGRTSITGICEGTNVGDLHFYLDRKRMTNDFHGLGAFLIMNEEWNTSVASQRLAPHDVR